MITIIKDLPKDILGFNYEGKVTAADYETVLYPAFEKAIKNSKNLKVLCVMTKKFEGFGFGAAVDDLQVGLKYFRDWKRVAFVSDKKWMNKTVSAFSFLIPGHVKSFKIKDMKEAINWLSKN